MKQTALICLFLLAFAAGAIAQEQQNIQEQIDGIISRMDSSSGAEYDAARAEGLALVPKARQYLQQKASPENWEGDEWREALWASVLLGRADGGEAFSKCLVLEGLKPQVYRRRTVSLPNVQRELEKLGAAGIPAMLEILLKTLDEHPLGTPLPAAGADAQTIDAIAKARATERRALELGIMGALAKTRARHAFRFLLEAAMRGGDDLRVAAAEGAARCAPDESVEQLSKILIDGNESEKLRAACAHALGWSKNPGSLTALGKALSDESAKVRSGAALGLARMASMRRWQIKKLLEDPAIRTMRKAAADALVKQLGIEKEAGTRGEIVQALGRIAQRSAIESLRELAENSDSEPVRQAASDAAERIARRAPPAVSDQ